MSEGHLDVGFGHRVWWRDTGRPDGVPAVVLHGGPGSGTSNGYLDWFDLQRHRVVLVDQRNCGRSRPHAGDVTVDLSRNTTSDLIADLETLRERLTIDRWLVTGASWGTTLALAYAQEHPDVVAGMVLVATVTTSEAEVDWITRGMAVHFPDQWQHFVSALPPQDRDGNLATAYHRLLMNSDPSVHEPAAAAWCAWEDTHVATDGRTGHNSRYDDPRFRLCFARIVTHYWSNHAFLPDGQIQARMPRLAGIPGVLIHGARDRSSPTTIAQSIHAGWPGARLEVVSDAGHGPQPLLVRTAIESVTLSA